VPILWSAQSVKALIPLRSFNLISISKPKRTRVNEFIKVPTVRLIDNDDEQVGIVGIEEARRLAQEAGLDLVEVAPQAKPPVCKIMDFGKHLYKEKKQLQKQRSKQKKSEVKGIRISLRTGQHDLDFKIKRARKFLEQGNSIKVALIFKGRELSHFDLALAKMDVVKEGLIDIAKVDQEPKKQGYNLFMILSPK
jgi:translation initiation factor IF-3